MAGSLFSFLLMAAAAVVSYLWGGCSSLSAFTGSAQPSPPCLALPPPPAACPACSGAWLRDFQSATEKLSYSDAAKSSGNSAPCLAGFTGHAFLAGWPCWLAGLAPGV